MCHYQDKFEIEIFQPQSFLSSKYIPTGNIGTLNIMYFQIMREFCYFLIYHSYDVDKNAANIHTIFLIFKTFVTLSVYLNISKQPKQFLK